MACQITAWKILKMMDWIPIVFVAFKALVLGTGMFFAIKWHYDQGKKGREKEARAVLRAGGTAAAVFTLSLLSLGFVTFVFGKMLGLDLAFP
jgi:hypothetical protein